MIVPAAFGNDQRLGLLGLAQYVAVNLNPAKIDPVGMRLGARGRGAAIHMQRQHIKGRAGIQHAAQKLQIIHPNARHRWAW